MSVRKLDAAAVAAALSTLEHWAVDGDFITRTYRTAGWKGTLMVVNTVGHLCEAAWHHPDLIVGYNRVTVKLQTHDVGGISSRDLELATEIEKVVTWRPAAGSSLEGVPDDPRYAYLVAE